VSNLYDKISVSDFSIKNIDTSGIDKIINLLPKNGVVDANIAEKGLLYTLEGQNLCQEKTVQIDRWIGLLESAKNKAWSEAALVKAKEAGYKTVKDKEWFAQSDESYIDACNNLVMAKACKKWLENKAGYFLAWHYALKTFLRRDYSIESASGAGYNIGQDNPEPFPSSDASANGDSDFGADDFEWGN
tara:strand:- start:8558 stop:9121 length:564 start_codon:yes stop_codon:yes gene_type:complete